MDGEIREGLEILGERIETQNIILNEKLSSLGNLIILADISDNLKGIYEELNEIRHILKDISEK